MRHNEVRDGVSDLAGKDFNPAHIRDDPKIFTGPSVRGGKAKAKGKGKEALPTDEGEEKGNLLIWDLWTHGMDSIHDMRVVNTDAVSYQSKTPEKCLDTAERKNKKKYLHTCLNESQHFTPFVA